MNGMKGKILQSFFQLAQKVHLTNSTLSKLGIKGSSFLDGRLLGKNLTATHPGASQVLTLSWGGELSRVIYRKKS